MGHECLQSENGKNDVDDCAALRRSSLRPAAIPVSYPVEEEVSIGGGKRTVRRAAMVRRSIDLGFPVTPHIRTPQPPTGSIDYPPEPNQHRASRD